MTFLLDTSAIWCAMIEMFSSNRHPTHPLCAIRQLLNKFSLSDFCGLGMPKKRTTSHDICKKLWVIFHATAVENEFLHNTSKATVNSNLSLLPDCNAEWLTHVRTTKKMYLGWCAICWINPTLLNLPPLFGGCSSKRVGHS